MCKLVFNLFIIEILELLDIGPWFNRIVLTFEINRIVCDALVKAFLFNVKGHINSYFGFNTFNSKIQKVTNVE